MALLLLLACGAPEPDERGPGADTSGDSADSGGSGACLEEPEACDPYDDRCCPGLVCTNFPSQGYYVCWPE